MEKPKRTRYEAELVNVNGKPLKKALLERWTQIARECYERKCNCENCDIIPIERLRKECKIKDYVEGYIYLGIGID